jgi:hypothetical protein
MISLIAIYADRLCARVVADLHHIGLAPLPVLASHEFWMAVLTILIFLLAAALQSLVLSEGGRS